MPTMMYGQGELLLECVLVKTTKRISFEIYYQVDRVTNKDDAGIFYFKATNGYEVISEHRMDIQSRRLWLHGAAKDESSIRSGSMHIPTISMAKESFPEFSEALLQWADYNNGSIIIHEYDFTRSPD